MNRTLIATCLLGGVLSLGIAACGGAGSAAQHASTSRTTSALQPAVRGGLTPPGAQLGFGKLAKVAWVPLSPGASQRPVTLDVSVESIEKGSRADLENVLVNPDQKRSTPYYVKVRVTDRGPTGPGPDDPDLMFRAIDDRGQTQSSVTFLGTFSRCDDRQPPRPFSSGKSYESCLTYLMPAGASIAAVHWNDGPKQGDGVTPYFEKPVVWTAG
jgi:hypothetical protein